MRTYDLLIDGERVATDDRRDVTDPYSGRVVGRVAVADRAHAERAVTAAARGLAEGWAQADRAAALEAARTLVLDRADDLARSIAEEAGKPLATARAEAARCADTLLYAAIEARRLAGTVVPFEGTRTGAGKIGFTLREPRGVVAAITPFNFPLNLVCHKLAPAFAAGCPVVLKPAGDTPLTAYAFAELLLEAGVPPAYLHVLTGPAAQIGAAITEHDEVAVVSFTGSTGVGHALAERNPHKHVLLELGSNSPVLVDASADLDAVAAALAVHGYSHAGQSCISSQRVYVHADVHDDLVARLVERVGALRVGDPLDEDTQVGPLIRHQDRDRVKAWIDEAVAAGAHLVAGGEVNPDGTLQPTVLDSTTQAMRVVREEVFGPVLAVQAVPDMASAVDRSNDSRYGLNAGIFTTDHATAMDAARRLRFGTVLVNEVPTFRADQMPYGGVRDSGNTREGPPWSVADYLDEKLVVLS